MVYESDFYTTRRPYSSSRPYVSSYNITPLLGPCYLYYPYTTFVRPIPHMHYPAHKRLVSIVHTPIRIYHAGTYLPIRIHARVRPSIIAAELNRIRYLYRPSSVSYTEKYLQSRNYLDFDDETREIRAKTDNLLRRIHVFVPRPLISDYDETSPERLRSDDYIRRIINAKNARKDIESLPWYSTPEKHRDIGSGHLACIKYAGGRPQSRRRPYYTVGDLIPGDVKSDVNLMSYYMKNRKAAEDALPYPHYERVREVYDAPASPVTRVNNVIHEEERPVEEPEVQMRQQTEVVAEVEPEIEVKAEKKKKEKKMRLKKESIDNEDMEGVEYDENGVRKQPDEESIKRVQEYIEKKAAEKKMEEERRAWEAAERKRIAHEKELARLAQIKIEEDARIAEMKEQERIEAERQALIQKAEEARQEAERLKEDEKLLNVAIAQAIADEEERAAKEMEEESKKKDQEEEKIVETVSDDVGAVEEIVVDDHRSEEHSIHADVSDQDNEAKPYEVDEDEHTQIEEDIHEEPDDLENPFVDGEGAARTSPVADEIVEDAPKVRQSGGAGGEQGFDWSQYESEPEAEARVETEQAPQVEEETTATADDQQVFEETEVESQAAEINETQIEEVQVTEEVQVEEETAQVEEEVAQAEEEQVEETQATEEETQEVEETHEDEEENRSSPDIWGTQED